MSAAPSKLVTYHYVFERGRAPAGIRPLYVDEFEAQLDWLAEHHEIVHPDAFPDALTTSRPACVLTFDDGTRDHLETVVPILEARGLSGVFFVITDPMLHGTMPVTHALHWALGHDEQAIWALLEEHARDRLGTVEALGRESDAKTMYHYEDSPLRARIKYAINAALTPADARVAMECIVRQLGSDLGEIGRRWFLDRDEVRELHERGMVVANHGVSHGSVTALGVETVVAEMATASNVLEETTGTRPRWYTCPFGGHGATPDDEKRMRAAMNELGIEFTVTAAPGDFDPDTDLLAIPRRDAAHLPPRTPCPQR